MRGSILINFDELVDDRGIDYFRLSVNNVVRYKLDKDSNSLYSTFINENDVALFGVFFQAGTVANINITRRDYTTDAEGTDRGIKETSITPTIVTSGSTSYLVRFTGSTVPSAYNFHYVINATTT